MRQGRRLALDWGKVRIGVAACDPAGLLAHPVTTLRADRDALAADLRELVAEYEPIEVVLGNPKALDGTEQVAAAAVREVAAWLQGILPGLPIRLVDERLSTAAAVRGLRAAGRTSRQQRAVVDQAAAVQILFDALEAERLSGNPPGELLEEAQP